MVLLNYSMVTAISMTKQPSPYHSIHFIYTHHRLWQALESNSSNDRTMGILIRFVADATCSSPSTRRRGRATSSCRRQFSMCGSDKLLEDAAGGLLSPLGPSPLCDYLSISDNSLLLYIVQRIMISSLRAQDPHARTPDTVSSNTPLNSVPTGSWIATVLTAQIISLEHKYS